LNAAHLFAIAQKTKAKAEYCSVKFSWVEFERLGGISLWENEKRKTRKRNPLQQMAVAVKVKLQKRQNKK